MGAESRMFEDVQYEQHLQGSRALGAFIRWGILLASEVPKQTTTPCHEALGRHGAPTRVDPSCPPSSILNCSTSSSSILCAKCSVTVVECEADSIGRGTPLVNEATWSSSIAKKEFFCSRWLHCNVPQMEVVCRCGHLNVVAL
ncbi:hypothetical protein PCANC_24935 [Puccinia coronata f. sp. avenae]|uniref:Uncharacterized protein n=1 Tax=Puccinia coronata f. sp. avenae TaxID=200324 RepID=A0A2N5S7U1_9BASI|nr:hypothetical protein PCANC_24935 [Puccinia coronata f. sp. avenae]